MEVRAYLRFFLKKWKTILLIFMVTFGVTAYLTFKTDPVYKSTTTYIVRLSDFSAEGTDNKNAISAIDTLSNRSEIAATYARVVRSQLIRDQAAKELGLSSSQVSGLDVSSQILAGTNVLEISVEGKDPALVRDFANSLGQQSVTYGQKLYEIYDLEKLDEATLPKKPIKPNTLSNLILGGVLGFILGFAFALLMEYLNAPAHSNVGLNILDDKTGTYNMRFFNLRLHQEINRAKRNQGVLSVALIDIDHRKLLHAGSEQSRLNAMKSVVSTCSKGLRDEDIMAPFSDTMLALLLLDLGGKDAKGVVERLLDSMGMISVQMGVSDQTASLNGAAGIAPYHSGDTASVEDLISRAQTALDSMKESTYGRVMISDEGGGENLQNTNKGNQKRPGNN
jgi:diguanylate cyclase (GGDEF)-like protein